MRVVTTCIVVSACGNISEELPDAAMHSDAPIVVVPGTTQADARASCQAILAAGATQNQLYWLDPDGGSTSNAFQTYCEMTILAGGWTLAMNIDPADGDFVPFTNTAFWLDDAEYGQITNR